MAIKYHSNIRLMDNNVLQCGTGDDLKIYHSGSHSYIDHVGDGAFYIRTKNNSSIYIQDVNGQGIAQFTDGGGCYFYHANNLKFSTTSTGIDITGEVKGDSLDIDGNADISGQLVLPQTSTTIGGSNLGNASLLIGSATTGIGIDTNEIVQKGDHLYIGAATNDKSIIFRTDATSAVLTLDSDQNATFAGDITVGDDLFIADNGVLTIGTGSDFKIHHDGSHSYIRNFTGDFYILNAANDKDIIFQSDDGAGGTTTYFSLDGSQATHDGSATTTLVTQWPDNSKIYVGSSGDGRFWHNGSHTYLQNTVGDLIIQNFADDKDIVFKSDDGSGGTTAYLTIDGGDEQVKVWKNLTLDDNIQAWFGSGNDLRIYHDGSDSYIEQAGNGSLVIYNSNDDADIRFRCDDGSGGVATYFSLDGSIAGGDGAGTLFTIWPDSSRIGLGSNADLRMYHDGTDSKIINLEGSLQISQYVDDGDIILSSDDGSGGVTPYITLDGGLGFTTIQKHVRWQDGIIARFGNSDDGSLYHSGGHFYMGNNTGDIIITNNTDDGDITFKSDDGSGGVTTYMYLDGGNNNIKFQKDTNWIDNEKAIFGTGSDLQILSDGNDGFINNETNHFYITNNANDCDLVLRSDDGSGGVTAYLTLDGSNTTIKIEKNTFVTDNTLLGVGDGSDLRMSHNGTNSFIDNYTGDFYIRQRTDDKDLKLQCDDGSGGVTDYITLDGSVGYTIASKAIRALDSVNLQLGTSADFTMQHNGSNTVLQNFTGDLYIQQGADDSRIRFQADDGAGGITSYFDMQGSAATHDGSATTATFTQWYDNSRIALGNGYDVQLWHDSTNTIFYSQTGNLTFQQAADDADIVFQSDDGSGGLATYFKLDGSSASGGTLYTQFPDNSNLTFGSADDLQIKHDGTDSKITNSTGDLVIRNLADDKDVIFQSDDGSGGSAEYLRLDGGLGYTVASKLINFSDNVSASWGAAGDLGIRHDGTDNLIAGSNGHIYITNSADDKHIILRSDDGSGGVTEYFRLDGALGYSIANKHILFEDSVKARFGSSADLEILHDGSNSYIHHNGTGSLYMKADTGNIQIINYTNDADIVLQSDDGSGGVTPYITLDGSASVTKFDKITQHADNVAAKFGYGNDLVIYHDGTNNHIVADNGDLTFKVNEDDHDIIFQNDDGSGGVTEYLRLDGSSVFTIASKTINWIDGVYGSWGSSGDLLISHNSTNSLIDNYTGDLYIRNFDNDKDIIFASDNGSGGDATYFRLDGSEVETRFHKATLHYDSIQAKYGDSGDLQIQHNGTDSQITNSTGHLQFTNTANNSDISFASDNGAGSDTIYFFLDGSLATHDGAATTALYTVWPDKSRIALGTGSDLQIYHNATNSNIENFTGTLQIVQTVDDEDIVFRCDDGSGGHTPYITLDGSATKTVFSKETLHSDSVKAKFGTSGDLEIQHNGTASIIDNLTGSLLIRCFADDSDIIFQSDDGSGGVATYFQLDGSHTETVFSESIRFADNKEAKFGASSDLSIHHNGSNSYITQQGTGDLYIMNTTDDKDIKFLCDDGSGGVETYFFLDGSASSGSPYTVFPDNSLLAFGTGNDMIVSHNATNSLIQNNTGDLYIMNQADDKDIIFQCDDGSGGTETYFFLDGSASGGNPVTIFPDSSTLRFGNSGDLQLYHDGSNSYVAQTGTGDLYIRNTTDDKDIIFQSDNGSGGIETYFFLDGSTGHTQFPDAKKLQFGSSNDMFIEHDGSNSYISSDVGTFYIRQTLNDGDLVLTCDDGLGGNTAYITLNGGNTDIDFHKNTHHLDNVYLKIGSATGGDLQIYHNASHSLISNQTGNLYIRNQTDDGDILFQADNGSGGDAEYFRLDGGEGRLVHSVNSRYLDNVVVMIGSGADLQLYHDGSNSYIQQSGTGDLYIQNGNDDKDIILRSDDGSGGQTAYITLDGSQGFTTVQKDMQFADDIAAKFGAGNDLRIDHNGSDSSITNNTGNLVIKNNTDDGDIIFKSDNGSGGTATYFFLDGSATQTTFQYDTRHNDSVEAKFGDSSDLQILHNGTNSFIQNNTGDLFIQNLQNDGDIEFKSDDGSGGIQTYLTIDGGITSILAYKDILMANDGNNGKIKFGASQDLQIYHDGSHSRIVDTGTGHLVLNATDFVVNNSGDTKNMIIATDGGSVSLYYNANKKFETTAYGAKTTYSPTSNTDGDVAGDIVHLGETTTVAGKIYYYKSDGAWGLVDANAASTCSGLLAVALGTSSSTNGMLLRGMATIANDPGAVGDTLFASTTAGEATATAPSGSGDIVRVIGYCLNATNGQIWFNPDGAFVEVA